MSKIKDFVKREVTLCVAFIAALLSCIAVPPDAGYLHYIDWRTLALLYCLMVVVAGLRGAGVFSALAHILCSKARDLRAMGGILVALCFFSSMLVTNDVALLTFVPLAVVVLGLAHQMKELAWVVVLQTVAANLGSMLTPVGNPQNLYLYSHYGMSMRDFFSATLPVWLISGVCIALLCLLLPKAGVDVFLGETPTCHTGKLAVYAALFAVCLLVVFRVLPWPVMLGIVLIVLFFFERPMLKHADFLLLVTFVCFFIFAGNLARIEAIDTLLRRLLGGHEMLVGAAASQVISNVPAAILLSGFTDNARGLLLGVNIGGLGTPIASLASLISLKLYSHSESADTRHYMLKFLLANFALLALLLGIGAMLP